ncbi:hypothetical protein FUAX_49770 (plasmid) [Fulvitalea axinellae]|uniref:Cytochrome c domain-containing protein n=1 Tax=Fulvitalea axinellae TaxID=1182444 RepID=A0AAU9CTK4_9BACT|nr:hypothetical protein FUAX_49770 [Fulvitalea axinellae]
MLGHGIFTASKQKLIAYAVLALLMLPAFTFAAKKKKKGVYVKKDTWEATMAASKKAYRERAAQMSFTPVESKVRRHGDEAEKITADIKGLDNLILIVDGTEDGGGYDHGVWGNAKLIDRNGKTVWLEDLDWVSARVGWRSAAKGTNLYKEKARVGGKTFDHALTTHAEARVEYKLDRKYVRFEAEVGIDKRGGSKRSSAIFRVLALDTESIANSVAADFPKESRFYANITGDRSGRYFTAEGNAFEKKALEKVIAKLDRPDAMRAQARKLLAQNASSEELIGLFTKIGKIIDAQDNLAMLDFEAMRLSIAHMNKEFKGKYNGSKYMAELKSLESQLEATKKALYGGDLSAVAWVKKAEAFKREALMANPLLDFDRLLAVRHKLGDKARSWGPNAKDMATPKANWKTQGSTKTYEQKWDSEIVELTNLRGDVASKTVYKPEGNDAVVDLDLSFDADKIMFTSTNKHDRWGLFEINVDGTGKKELSPDKYPDLDFYDACYMPDGRVAMVSNVSMQGVPCVNGSDPVGNLCLLDPKTKTFKQLNYGQDNDWDPVILPTGRIMYLRWEYTDNVHYFSRILMHSNPDGTGKKEYYGSGSYWPNSLFDAKPIPGHKTKLVGVVSGHHGVSRSGELVIFDPAKGRKEADGVVQRIPGRGQKVEPIIKDRLVDGVWPQFLNPYPLDEDYYLVSAKMKPGGLWGLYLVDTFDNMTLVKEYEGEGIRDVFPLKKRPTPPVIPDKVIEGAKDATVYIADIYEGQGLKGVPRGTVKKLRLFSYKFAYNVSKSNNDGIGIESSWESKRIIGTVPVYEDGSAIFKIPANTAISLQPLDEKGQAMQLMRSWLTAMPGETVSCIGCHEDQNMVPVPKRTIASTKQPAEITPFYGEPRPFSFANEVQPVLDRKCVSCHNGNNDKIPNLADKTPLPYRNLSRSYFDLQKFVRRPGPESDQYVLTPMEFHVSTSAIIQKLDKGHHNVKLTQEERDRLVAWIDLNAPYYADFHGVPEYRGSDQKDRRVQLMKEINGLEYTADAELARANALRESRGPIEPVTPEPEVDPVYKKAKAKRWPFDASKAKEMQAKNGEETKTIDLGNGQKIELVRIPAGEFVMGSDATDAEALPTTRVKMKRSFWMAKYEVNNAQMRALFPEHDSRTMDQQWKDHTGPGYDANRNEQPAIRMSWQEAVAFCEKLSKKTGLKIALPTEAQWEWACRAGSDNDMAYGTASADFSAFANLADERLSDMAVQGVDPHPMGVNNSKFYYYDIIPRTRKFDDGSMLQATPGKYKPNAWGLYDMHGNVAEWTRSDFLPYPYKAKDGRNDGNTNNKKVVRGGSWRDRPAEASSSFRKAFEPWQRVYNVGFRIVIEE